MITHIVMKNFGYLATIRNFLKTSASEKGSTTIGRLILCLITSFIGLVLFLHIIQKVYEVPVYTTKINIVSPGYPPNSGGINICLLRNYDRPIKPTFPVDSVLEKYLFTNKYDGGIFVSFSCLLDSFDKQKVSYRRAGEYEYICRCDSNGMIFSRNVLDSIFNDSIFKKKEVEKDIIPIYTSIETSDRQLFHLYLSSPMREKTLRVKDSLLYEYFFDGKIFNHQWYGMHDYVNYWRCKSKNDYSTISEQWTIVSSIDSVMPIFHMFRPLSFSKPNVLTTAEDISRLVEIIELNNINPYYKGNISDIGSLTIGYQTHTIFPEHITPEPDEITLSYIRYTDKEKIKEIGNMGLRFYVKFPMMENIQDARIFILSAIITGIGGFFFSYLFRLLLLAWKKTNNFRNKYKLLNLIIICLFILLILFIIQLIYRYAYVDPFYVD